ncbi:MAG: TIGR01212 family radical SAM protein [Lachnospiraceae bacterium]|nr:TIGR01212 family radical SAM protein [Lachnospiraceae bacterium]
MYTSVNDYLQRTFNEKIYKIAIDAGFTCPNRDGTKGSGGCIFCSGNGSGDFAESRRLSVTEQIEAGKARVAGKKPGKYIAYFQAFTNTYAPVDVLRARFSEAIDNRDVVAISVATRPDCLPDDVIELLGELNKMKPVWVELGLQTIHDKTAKYIRRGYDLSIYDKAVRDLKEIGIPQIIVHVILGLPGEDMEMMLETVRYVVRSGATGIKLQLLHVLEGTDLAKDYRDGKFEALSMEEYIDILIDCLKEIPDDMVVHRITGDGPKRDLIAPLWSGDKKRVLNSINKALRENEWER